MFPTYRTPDSPDQIVDGDGIVWLPAASPGRNGEPVYYSTGEDNWALTATEIKARYGIKPA
jgi:hypothetical protein